MHHYEFHVEIFDGDDGGIWGNGVKKWGRDTDKGRRQTLDTWLERMAVRPGFLIISITQTNTILTAIVRTDDEDDHDD